MDDVGATSNKITVGPPLLDIKYVKGMRAVVALVYASAMLLVSLVVAIRLDLVSGLYFSMTQIQGLSQPLVLHRSVMSYLLWGDQPSASFSTAEWAHFADVASRLMTLHGLALVMGVISTVCWWRLPWARRSVLALAVRVQWVLLLVVAMFVSRWVLFFRGWHPLLFPNGGWDFGPNDLIVRLYGQSYFVMYVAYLIGGWGMVWLGAWGLSRGYAQRFSVSLPVKWALGVVLILMPPAFYLGYRMLTYPNVAWIAYWVLCLIVLLSSVLGALWLGRRSLWLLLMLWLVVYQTFAMGTLCLALDAERLAQSEGMVLNQAIVSYRQRHGRMPKDLLEAIPGYDVSNAPFGPWQYRSNGRRYVLLFKGPLDFHYRYDSAGNRWHTMNRP